MSITNININQGTAGDKTDEVENKKRNKKTQ